MQKTAIVCVTNDLVTDNRVYKQCLTLQKCGYFVIGYGRLLPDSASLNRTYFTLRKKHKFNAGILFYAEYSIRLFFYLLGAQADLIIANDLDTLPAAYCAARIRRKRLIFDAHELFSEVPELTNRPIIKLIWRKIEDIFIPRTSESLTVCQSIADYMNKRFNTKTTVIRNMPLRRTISANNAYQFDDKKIILYQGAINIGRGLEWIIDAMPLINNAVLLIIGDGDISNQLKKRVEQSGLQAKVIFTGKINAEELAAHTANANIGLCLLENKGLNYYYSLPNRIFDYLHAGVPVLATDFPEIRNIVHTYNTGMVINHYEPAYLAETISLMFNTEYDKKHFQQISEEFCWENEEKKLIQIIQNCSE